MNISTMKSIVIQKQKEAKVRRIANRAFGTLRASFHHTYMD